MSRTNKGSKGAGFEYWGRRPTKYRYADPGKDTKRNTHRLERQAGKHVDTEDQYAGGPETDTELQGSQNDADTLRPDA